MPLVLTLIFLAAMGVAAANKPGLQDAEPYHARVRAAAAAIPYNIGQWDGEDKDLPPAAIKLLRPNVLFSRVYRRRQSSGMATLLFVQCKDARDLAGHYPPVCYPAHGWTMEQAQPREWVVNGLAIPGKEYEFSFRRAQGVARIVVQNFMITPDGRIFQDMVGVRKAAADYTRHFYGAAQVQVMTAASVDANERDRIFAELIGALMDVIQEVQSGGNK